MSTATVPGCAITGWTERGIRGNTHLMMVDLNNLEIADIIQDWLAARRLMR
jgi:hypothetical protein